jgi:hypothetical protein
MQIKKLIQILLGGFILLYTLNACDELPCDYTDGVNVYVGFYQYDGITLADTLIDSLVVYLMNDPESSYTDSMDDDTQSISFPLSMINDTSTVILKIGSFSADTIIFYYNKSLNLLSHTCGFVNFFEITNINTTNNQLDSIWIRDELINYDDDENIKIYF